MLEVLAAVAVGMVLLLVAYWMLTSSTRVLTRGQNKLFDTTQAQILFRHLELDLHCLAAPPVVSPLPPRVVLERFGGGARSTVEWRFVAVKDGTGSGITRAITGGAGRGAQDRYCLGTVDAVEIRPLGTPDHPALCVKLALKTAADAVAARFEGTFFYQNQIVDPSWNPVPNP